MSDLEHGRELLEMARADLNALKGMLDSDPSFLATRYSVSTRNKLLKNQ